MWWFLSYERKSHTTMQAKCKHLVLKGKYIKKHLQFTLDVIAILRFIPTLPLFSWLWKTFLATPPSFGWIDASWLVTKLWAPYSLPSSATMSAPISCIPVLLGWIWWHYPQVQAVAASLLKPYTPLGNVNWLNLGGRGNNRSRAACLAEAIHRSFGKNGIPGTLLRRYPSCHQAKTGSLSMAQRLRALVVQRAANFAKLPQENMCLIQHLWSVVLGSVCQQLHHR